MLSTVMLLAFVETVGAGTMGNPELDALVVPPADHDILEVVTMNEDFSDVFSIPISIISICIRST